MPQENETQNTPTQTPLSYTQAFDQALALQQQQNWDSALKAYQTLLDQSIKEMGVSQAAVVYHNMSSLAYEKGDFLKAYIWSKKSLALDPNNQLAHESFKHYSTKIEIPTIAHQISNFDHLKNLVSTVSLDAWLIFSIILIFATIWLALKNILISKKNQLANNFSNPEKWPLFLLGSLTLLVLSITYIRYQDASTLRGLVITEKAQVQTAPGENKPVIFEAQAGLELEVLKSDQGYFLVRYAGAFSGWIKKAQVELMSLSFEQSK